MSEPLTRQQLEEVASFRNDEGMKHWLAQTSDLIPQLANAALHYEAELVKQRARNLEAFAELDDNRCRRIAAEELAEDELQRLREAIAVIYRTQVYEEPGNPEKGVSVEFVAAINAAARLAGIVTDVDATGRLLPAPPEPTGHTSRD